MSLASLLLAAGLASCADLGTDEIGKLAGKDQQVMLHLEKTSLDRVLKMLGRVGKFQTTYQGFTPTVPANFENVTVGGLLEELAEAHGLAYRVVGPASLEIRAPALPGVGGVTEPRVKAKVPPVFPAQAKETHGRVVLSAVVCEDGGVGALAVLQSPVEIVFREAAMEAVRGWTFEPATLEGKPVPAYFTVTLDFARD